MKIKMLTKLMCSCGIKVVTGIPDSTLQEFCAYLDEDGKTLFASHIVPANEGAAIGIAIGEYLATGNPACVYMQNSGLGNAVNPITSLANNKVYGIPMLLLVGWRGEPGKHDEPQHKYMGEITEDLLKVLDIPYFIIDSATSEQVLSDVSKEIREIFSKNRQYAILVKRGTFEPTNNVKYRNDNVLIREEVIKKIVNWLHPEDIVISTTGKISRELYENLDKIKEFHDQAFLCVGGMGHANMIAYQIARRNPDKRVICLDGDGALLMHLGSFAVIGSHSLDNLIHICLDNEAHESVGGMYTGARGVAYDAIAKACGYHNVYCISSDGQLEDTLTEIDNNKGMCFVMIKVAISSRADLIRPRESAEENKNIFMDYLRRDR